MGPFSDGPGWTTGSQQNVTMLAGNSIPARQFLSRFSGNLRVSKQSPPSATPDLTNLPAAAKVAGLRYVNDRRAGITRVRGNTQFTYRHPDGRRVTAGFFGSEDQRRDLSS